jgi:transposase
VLANPERYKRIGEESSDRLAFREATYMVLRLERPKFIALDAQPSVEPPPAAVEEDAGDEETPSAGDEATPSRSYRVTRVLCADLPGSVWPRVMADVSAVTQVVLAKYDMCLPLHRQERASPRCGYHLPRSTQCDWIETAYNFVYRIVDAMFEDSLHAHCLATDATSAPIRTAGKSVPWHVFVFIADASHVVFRPARHHDGETIRKFVGRYKGYLLADAATIYDALYEAGHIVEVSCWAHLRRYFFKARATEPALALEALAIIGKIFEIGRETEEIPMPGRTADRARRMQPHLELLDRWIAANRKHVEPRTKLAAAFTYYDNQYDTLRTFLRDGDLRLDNNVSEQQLRHLVLGLHNWNVFETSAGLDWYCVFRSLIASCALHGIEAQEYLNEVLRLAPHWPVSEMLALSPRYWAHTRASLTAEQRAIISPPWVHYGAKATPAQPTATQAA